MVASEQQKYFVDGLLSSLEFSLVWLYSLNVDHIPKEQLHEEMDLQVWLLCQNKRDRHK